MHDDVGELLEHFDAVLEIGAGGRWTWSPVRESKLRERAGGDPIG